MIFSIARDEILILLIDEVIIWKGSAHSELRKAQRIVYLKWSIPAQDIVD